MFRRTLLLPVLLAATVPCLRGSDAPAAEPGGSRPVVSVVLPANASSPEQIAAQELAKFLAKLYTNTQFQVADHGSASGRVIYLGTRESAPELWKHLGNRTPQGPESYVVAATTIDDRRCGLIVGTDPAGVMFGVYGLLRQMGCGFYLSFDAIPEPRSEPFTFDGWELADRPLVFDRIVFNWHNFLSGCSSWSREHWKHWITQSQKAGYNAVMVHAYGNNPMAGFAFGGLRKPVGYLSSTRVGRDWATMHVSDVRRLWGGEVFDSPVFGSSAAVAGDDRERTRAAQQLMQDAFAHAGKRGVKVYFAVDVDTASANPQPLIQTLPESARFAISTQGIQWMGQKPLRTWLANPDTPEGFRYYKAQVEQLMATYPQIGCLVVWFRSSPTPWVGMKLDELPQPWREQYEEEVRRTPSAKDLWRSHNFFALGKVAAAFDRALKEIGRDDVELAAGSWGFGFLPPADRFFPKHVKLLPLDYSVLHGRSQFETTERRAVIARVGVHRPVSAIAWAHHDDGTYLGRPFAPFTQFQRKLADARSTGFGIIHWTTRPLDLYFDGLSRQTWQSTREEPPEETCRDMAGRCFGPANADVLGRYLYRWVTEAPSFSRETSPYFFDPRQEVADPAELEPKMQQRLALLDSVDESTLSREQRERLDYLKGLERFILDAHRVETQYRRAKAHFQTGQTAEAQAAIAEADPVPVIRHYARFSRLGGITRGEQGSVVSMNTRWLPHIVQLRQQLGMSPVRYNFGPTSHDPLAQSPGRFTFHFDRDRNVWQTFGEQETGAAAFALSSEVKVELPEDASPAWAEIGRSGIESSQPVSLTLRPILGAGVLPAGQYRLTLLMIEPPAAGPNQRVFDVVVGAGSGRERNQQRPATPEEAANRVDLFQRAGGRNRLVTLDRRIELRRPDVVQITLSPVKGKALICGAVLAPANGAD